MDHQSGGQPLCLQTMAPRTSSLPAPASIPRATSTEQARYGEQESPDGIGNVVVSMLASRVSDGLLVAATHGRGVFSANVEGTITSNEDGIEVPTEARLQQNYPNPFNPETTIQYELSTAQHVELSVYDATGRRVKVLENEFKNAGTHEVQWNGTNQGGRTVASGTYIYRLHVLSNNGSIEQSLSGQMVFLK